jgi:dienelactone hydrolase
LFSIPNFNAVTQVAELNFFRYIEILASSTFWSTVKYFIPPCTYFLIAFLSGVPNAANAFWGKEYEEPPPIVRAEPPNLQEVQKLKIGNKALNEQIIRFGLARHVPLIPDWSKAQTGKLFGSWNIANGVGKQPTIIIQHGGNGGPGTTDYGHARWFLGQGFNVLVLDSFWSRGFISNWKKIDSDFYGGAFSTLGANTRARDAFAAARWLREQPQVDASRIFLMGGSQGGWSVLRAFTDEKSITETHKELFRAGVSIYPACWSWQQTPGNRGANVPENLNPRLGPFYAPVLLVTVELEPPGSATDINSCNPNLVKWASKHIRLENTTHAFDAESPPEKPVNRCENSSNPHWCQASGGRDPITGNCKGAPKADSCADVDVTKDLRIQILDFLKSF